MRISFYTLGCKVNQTETGAMQEFLHGRGHEIVSVTDNCDAVVINTCTVTSTGDKKSRHAIRQLRARHPDAIIAVCGCLPQTADISGIDGIDLIGGSHDRLNFALSLESGGKFEVLPQPNEFEILPFSAPEGRTRAFLKIQDGCENNCSYCIIPRARGACRSLPANEAVLQAKSAEAQGFRELVITGIEISSYTPSLVEVVRQICAGVPNVRVRLGSLEPSIITEEFVERLRGLKNLCHHFHPALQSGCDEILTKMNRHYNMDTYRNAVKLLRDAFDGCAITSDLICGFPGESEQNWSETCENLKNLNFSALHVFPYSQRKGTPAALLPNQIPRTEKEARCKEARTIASLSGENYAKSFIGKSLSVLFETSFDGLSDNYLRVKSSVPKAQNELTFVKITRYKDGVLHSYSE